MKSKREVGSIGESVCCEYLESIGFEIKKRNFLTRHGEIDIIAENDRYIVFAEVKLRSMNENNLTRYGRPSVAVTKNKMKNIIYSARIYLGWGPITKSVRFDVLEVYSEELPSGNTRYRVKHIPAAFTLDNVR
ncbi:MAG: YraN family protein [Ruminococcaceae bacterium]|nr:YraN family protein [Oscillospiraceae bacterium]